MVLDIEPSDYDCYIYVFGTFARDVLIKQRKYFAAEFSGSLQAEESLEKHFQPWSP